MSCVHCKRGEPVAGTTPMTYERGEAVVVIRKILAPVCPTCGEAYFDEVTSTRLDRIADEVFRAGVQIELREYAAA